MHFQSCPWHTGGATREGGIYGPEQDSLLALGDQFVHMASHPPERHGESVSPQNM